MILPAGSRGRGARGGASGPRIPRDGGGGSTGAGGRNGNGEGRTSVEPGTDTGTTAVVATTTTTAQASGRRGQHDQVSSDGAGEEYRARGGAEGESSDESTGWSGGESDGPATDEEATNAEGTGWAGEPRTATSGGTQESGADRHLGDAMAGGGNTRKASSTAADARGAGGRHGARTAQKGRFTGQQETRLANSWECGVTTEAARPPEWSTIPPEWGVRRGAARPLEWQETHGGPAREWEGESSCHRALTPPECQICPGEIKPPE